MIQYTKHLVVSVSLLVGVGSASGQSVVEDYQITSTGFDTTGTFGA